MDCAADLAVPPLPAAACPACVCIVWQRLDHQLRQLSGALLDRACKREGEWSMHALTHPLLCTAIVEGIRCPGSQPRLRHSLGQPPTGVVGGNSSQVGPWARPVGRSSRWSQILHPAQGLLHFRWLICECSQHPLIGHHQATQSSGAQAVRSRLCGGLERGSRNRQAATRPPALPRGTHVPSVQSRTPCPAPSPKLLHSRSAHPVRSPLNATPARVP